MLSTLIGYSLFTLYVVLGVSTFIALSGIYELEPVDTYGEDREKVVSNLLAIVGTVFVSVLWPVYVGYHAVVKLLPKLLSWLDS